MQYVIIDHLFASNLRKKIIMGKRLILFGFLTIVLNYAFGQSVSQNIKVLVITTDGLRWEEVFKGLDTFRTDFTYTFGIIFHVLTKNQKVVELSSRTECERRTFLGPC